LAAGVRFLPGEINIIWIVLKAAICLIGGTVAALVLIGREDFHSTVLLRSGSALRTWFSSNKVG